MKAFYLFLPTFLAGAFSCRRQPVIILPVPSSHAYEKGESFFNRNSDSAFYYFNQAATTSKDSLQVAMAYNSMGAIQSDAGDYFGSQESLLMSLKYLDKRKENNAYCLLADYNELGTTSLNLKNYEAAISYYDLALKLIKNEGRKAIALNNKAVVYQKMHRYDQAIDIYRKIIDQSKNNKKEYARILSNMARARWLQDSGYQAAPELLTALQIRRDENDEWGLNASYSHLSDYYSHSRPDSALLYAGKMYIVARKLNSPDDELEALQKLITLGPPGSLRSYFSRYQYLSDSLQTSRNAAKNQFALIRYDAERSKADNLRLQKDNTENRIQIFKQRILIYGTIGLFAIIFIITAAWYRKRRQQMIWQSRQIIRENQLKISQKVHDVVANGLYRIMTEVEYHEPIDKEQLLDKIEVLYEKSRDISYEQATDVWIDFQSVISKLLGSFATSDIKVLVVGNHKDLWNKVKDHVKNELEPVLQELMINMKKHSSARNVVVRFELQDGCLKAQYSDDGIGLPSTFHYGNGLTNTENRIKRMDGRIIFDKNATKGLKIAIYLPIALIRHD